MSADETGVTIISWMHIATELIQILGHITHSPTFSYTTCFPEAHIWSALRRLFLTLFHNHHAHHPLCWLFNQPPTWHKQHTVTNRDGLRLSCNYYFRNSHLLSCLKALGIFRNKPPPQPSLLLWNVFHLLALPFDGASAERAPLI